MNRIKSIPRGLSAFICIFCLLLSAPTNAQELLGEKSSKSNIQTSTKNDPFDYPEWVEINSNEIWTTEFDHKSFKKGIKINSGHSLTIEDITLKFGSLAKILIEPGATLKVDSSLLTHYCYDPRYQWQGIEVRGIKDAHQYDIDGENSQGKLILTNHTTIEHAYCGVKIQNCLQEYEKSGGGIIEATNAHFINNSYALKAYPYQNFNPYTEQPTSDFSKLEYCTFEINSEYIGSAPLFAAHVNLSEIDGYSFSGCDFNFSGNNLQNIADSTYGIYSDNSCFTITGICIDPIEKPCTEHYISSFSHFFRAISAIGSKSKVYIDNTNFEGNKYGVYLDTVHMASITESTFLIGNNDKIGNDPPLSTANSNYGVYIKKSPAFIIEYNEFEAADNLVNISTGIKLIKTCSQSEISHNSFKNLTIANHAWGQNFYGYYTAGDIGVVFYCNENLANIIDIKVENDTTYPYPGGIQYCQGDVLQSTGNSWSKTKYNVINTSGNIVSFYTDNQNTLTGFGSMNFVLNIQKRDCSCGGSRKSDSTEKEIEKFSEKSRVTIFPNPADNLTTIKYKFASLSASAKLKIYSMTGVKVYDNIIYGEQSQVKINTQQWAGGIYFFTLSTKTEIVKGKFVINH